MRRLQAYYLTLAREIEKRLQKKKNDPEEEARAASRLEATKSDYLKKIAEDDFDRCHALQASGFDLKKVADRISKMMNIKRKRPGLKIVDAHWSQLNRET